MLARLSLNDGTWGERALRYGLLSAGACFAVLFLLLPLLVVFIEAFSQGLALYIVSISDEEALSAIRLTLVAAFFAVFFNLIFGVAAAWLIARFTFRGRKLLLTLIDTPLAVSPVIAGLIFVLLYGARGPLAPALDALGIKVIFTIGGIVVTTMFVTIPYIARELIPFMMEQGSVEEEAALTLGAKGHQVFRFVTLPNIKWALLYGVILCNSRAMGEFGAVSVVSGHIRGETNTVPLHIEILYNEYKFAAAFAVSSLLALLALGTLLLKAVLERGGHNGLK
ncbi:MAG: sulfate ABC transporter permease subunit CysW [Deltaproteobacteria bacterium]|nr:sulfate ABC transporter permease subunit CysW [Deltaproteobacteria bacterium]